MTESEVLDWIARHRTELRTPLYLYDAQSLVRARDRLAALLPDGSSLFYSLKANPQPALVKRFRELGLRPEIASAGEHHMCTAGGVSPTDILVGGVSKSAEYLRRVCDSGCHAIVLDSLSEWAALAQVLRAGARSPRILLRIAPGVALGGLDMAGPSQFGLDPEQAVSIARECTSLGAEFLGLHFYFGSQRLRPEPVIETVRIAGERVSRFLESGIPVRVVDIGLGCGVPYLERDASLDYGSLANELARLWQQPPWPGIEVWSEAGRSLVGESGYFIARVTETKTLHGKTFAFLDGGINVHNPGIGVGRFLRSNARFRFVTAQNHQERAPVDLVGNLCTSADRLGQDVSAPPLASGDLVVVPHSGAYTHTTGMWGFNSQGGFHEALLEADGSLVPFVPQYEYWTRAYA